MRVSGESGELNATPILKVYAAVDTARARAYGLVPITGHTVIRRALRLLVVGLLTTAAFASAAPAALHEGESGSVRLRVMTLNIFYGGDELDLRTGDWCAKRSGCQAAFAKVLETIRASGADVIGLEEAEHRDARAHLWIQVCPRPAPVGV